MPDICSICKGFTGTYYLILWSYAWLAFLVFQGAHVDSESTKGDMMSLPTPIVHLNGTGAKDLIGQATDVHCALKQAQDLMRKARPHGRDYYTSPDPDAFNTAREAHDKLYSAIDKISMDYLALALAIQG